MTKDKTNKVQKKIRELEKKFFELWETPLEDGGFLDYPRDVYPDLVWNFILEFIEDVTKATMVDFHKEFKLELRRNNINLLEAEPINVATIIMRTKINHLENIKRVFITDSNYNESELNKIGSTLESLEKENNDK